MASNDDDLFDPYEWGSLKKPVRSQVDPELADEVKKDHERQGQIRAVVGRWERAKAGRDQRAERRQRQRDMGLGYLIYACRRGTRRSQRTFAQRMEVSPAAVCRWESGTRLPSIKMLQRAAHQARQELMVGLWDPKKEEITFLAVIDDELPLSELEMIKDPYKDDLLKPVPWRKRLEIDQ